MDRKIRNHIIYTLPLADPRAVLEIAGGKGASLARISAAGLPVPDGFHITTEAYRKFVAVNNLQPAILADLEKADVTVPPTLDEVSKDIGKRFLAGRMPGEIQEAIIKAYAGFSGSDEAVAVRSSATAEDLPGLSFAGQQETYLNIRGIEEVLAAIKRCWSSLWTARAIGYRIQHAINQDAVSLAVVVQRLAPAEVSGILFTAHPVSGRREEAMISAAWGLGEAIVGGMVTPDTLVIEKSTGRVLSRATADKRVMTMRVPGGTEERAVPDAKRRAPALNDRDAAELVRIGVQIERIYGLPMDIEWALAEGRFAILQARPITALPVGEAEATAEWKIPDPKKKYTRGSILEFMSDPVTPLFGTLGVDAIDTGSRKFFKTVAGGYDFWPGGMIVTVNGYAYSSLPTGRDMVVLMVRGLIPAVHLFRIAEKRWREDGVGIYRKTVERWEGRPLSDLASREILTGAREILAAMVNLYTIIQSGVIGNAVLSESLFTGIYDRLIKRPEDPPAPTFLLGFDSAAILAEKSLYDLAEEGRANPALAAYLSTTPAEGIAGRLRDGEAPPEVEAGAWKKWQARWQAHLQNYGHILYDLDFSRPVPVDDPCTLLETGKHYLSGKIGNPYDRQRKLAERRQQADVNVEKRVGGWRRNIFRKLVAWAQKCVPLRENAIADMGIGYPLLRRMLLELGRRLVHAGGIEQAEDVFWLSQAEVEAAAVALDGGGTISSLEENIPPRKSTWQTEKRLAPPAQLPLRSKWMGIALDGLMPSHSGNQSGVILKGWGASAGRVTAKACVIRGPEDFNRMKPGAVLVAAITTPGWTPLFAMAAAVVTDIGGPLSHSSIVAREYGIPAVLGTGMATRRIRNGQSVSVDGSAGRVIIQDSESLMSSVNN